MYRDRSEIAIRQALGAGWADGAKLVLAESAMLACAAGVVGLIVARLALPLMRAIVPHTIGPVILPGMDRLELDSTVMLFSAGVCGLVTLLSAIEPLRRLNVSSNHQMGLGDLARWRYGASTNRTQKMLAVVQIAMACTLLTGASELLMSYDRLMRVAPGFAVTHRQVVHLSMSDGTGPTGLAILVSVSASPGVRSAALSTLAPGVIGGPRTGVRLMGDPPARSIDEAKKAFFRVVTPGFMRTAGVRVVRGREFGESESGTGARAMMISRQLAERYFKGQDVLGRGMLTPIDDKPWTVVGIADDIRQLGLDRAGRVSGGVLSSGAREIRQADGTRPHY